MQKETPTKEKATAYFKPAIKKDFISAIEKTLLLSYLMGRDHAAVDLMLSDETPEEIPFEQAVSFFKGKVSLNKTEWKAIEEKLRFRAFTLAVLESHEQIERVRKKLLGVLEKDGSLTSFYNDVKGESITRQPFYWETVFRTNFQSAYNAGRREQFLEEPPDAYELIVLEDGRTSSICRPLSGLVLPVNHPFWKTHWPPLHFNCRSTVRGVYKNQRAYKSLSAFSRYTEKDFPAQKGFGGDPSENGTYWMMLPAMFERGLKNGAITMLNFQNGQIATFDELWAGYKRERFESGFVDVHQKAAKESEFAENYAVAKIIAEQTGSKIKLLPIHNPDGWKNPDYLINGEIWELKTPKAGTKNAIEKSLSRSDEQAKNVVIHINDKAEIDFAKEVIYNKFTNKDHPAKNEKVILIKGNKVEMNTAEGILKKEGWR